MTLSSELIKYLTENEGWHKKVELYMLSDELGYSPETCGRCLRQLTEEKKLDVDYYDSKYSKGLAKYRIAQPLKKVVYRVEGIGEIIKYEK